MGLYGQGVELDPQHGDLGVEQTLSVKHVEEALHISCRSVLSDAEGFDEQLCQLVDRGTVHQTVPKECSRRIRRYVNRLLGIEGNHLLLDIKPIHGMRSYPVCVIGRRFVRSLRCQFHTSLAIVQRRESSCRGLGGAPWVASVQAIEKSMPNP